MCGRFTLTVPTYEELASALGVAAAPELAAAYRPRYNVAPTDPSWILRARDGKREIVSATWGLVPHFAKSLEGRAKAINARAETIADTPKFRDAFTRRRCVVLADGFYEWKKDGGARQPIWFTPKDGRLLYLAGISASWVDPATGTRMRSFSILTCAANAFMRGVHDRMPVILREADVDIWLAVSATGEVPAVVRALMRPAPDDLLAATPVSSRANNVKNDDPMCILPGVAEAAPEKPKRRAACEETLPLFESPSQPLPKDR